MSDILQKSLTLLKTQINLFAGGDIIELANIAALNDGDDFLSISRPVVLSIVNIEQDYVMRSPHVYEKVPVVNELIKFPNPTQHLTLSLLFTAYAQEQKELNYLEGLRKLETVTRFLQTSNTFTVDAHKITLSMESLSLPDLNQLWSMLGSKYMPSVLYKMRSIPIQTTPEDGGIPIEEIKIRLWEDQIDDDTGFLEEQIFTD